MPLIPSSADFRFTTLAAKSSIEITKVSVMSLGFPERCHFQRSSRARSTRRPGTRVRWNLVHISGLLSLISRKGSLGQPPSQGRAPPASITVASMPLDETDETPKGFYLRPNRRHTLAQGLPLVGWSYLGSSRFISFRRAQCGLTPSSDATVNTARCEGDRC